jgi:hypothetical protein
MFQKKITFSSQVAIYISSTKVVVQPRQEIATTQLAIEDTIQHQ